MFLIHVLFCMLAFSVSEISSDFARRSCFDCVSILSCESGLDFARRLGQGTLPTQNRQTFFDAICGTDSNNPKLPKVCCSAFPMKLNSRASWESPNSKRPKTSNVQSANVQSPNVQSPNVQSPNVQSPNVHTRFGDPIETHPNIRLLPLTSCGDIDGSRIINGRTPKLYELPWMTLISYSTSRGPEFRCGGSVINSRYILTAAHCVTNGTKFNKIAGVRIGEFDYRTQNDCQGDYENMICESKIQDIAVEEIIPHESFTGQRELVEGDIALLRLKKDINMTNNAAPICLPVYSALRNTRLAGKTATIAGWGITEKHMLSSKLVKAEVPILDSDVCSHFYNRYEHQRNLLIENSFCAGDMIKDSCSGDSGGPLIVESDFNSQVRLVQYGIVSFGPKMCGSQFPGVYTDVSKYMQWILDKIRA